MQLMLKDTQLKLKDTPRWRPENSRAASEDRCKSYSPGNSRKRDENNLAKWLGFPHLQDTLDGPGRTKSLPQIGLSRLSSVAHDDEALSASRPGSLKQRPRIDLLHNASENQKGD